MTLAAPPARITPEDLLRIPDNNTLELVDGRLVEKNVCAESSEIEGLIYFAVQAFLLKHKVAKTYPASLGYQCFPDEPSKVRKPEVTVIRLERLAALPDPNPGFMPIIPDLAVEVVSTNDTVYEVAEKVHEYLTAGFPLVWVVDPKTRSVTVHPHGSRPSILTADDDITAANALPGFRCKVADFFPAAAAPAS